MRDKAFRRQAYIHRSEIEKRRVFEFGHLLILASYLLASAIVNFTRVIATVRISFCRCDVESKTGRIYDELHADTLAEYMFRPKQELERVCCDKFLPPPGDRG